MLHIVRSKQQNITEVRCQVATLHFLPLVLRGFHGKPHPFLPGCSCTLPSSPLASSKRAWTRTPALGSSSRTCVDFRVWSQYLRSGDEISINIPVGWGFWTSPSNIWRVYSQVSWVMCNLDIYQPPGFSPHTSQHSQRKSAFLILLKLFVGPSACKTWKQLKAVQGFCTLSEGQS